MTSNNRLPKIAIYILIGLAFLATSAFGLRFYQKKFTRQEQALPIQPETIFYEHPNLRYTLKYPATWSQTAPGGVDERYEEDEFAIYSPDYTKGGEGFLGYPKVTKGAMILIVAKATDEQSIDDYFNKEELVLKLIAKNKHQETVDGQLAIQYDWSYEGWEATETDFIKNGLHYAIKLRYADEKEKESNWDVYTSLLASFRAP